MSFPHLLTLLDHFYDLEVALLPPLAVVLFQYVYLTLLSLCISLLTGIVCKILYILLLVDIYAQCIYLLLI